MKNQQTKLENRLNELINRTSEIFKIDEETAKKLFTKKKSVVVLLNDQGIEIIKEGLNKKLLTKIDWFKNTYIINSNKSLFTQSKEFENGHIYIQNASSLLPILALNPKENEKILDMCAAPGGKTVQIANLTQNKSVITVNDADVARVGYMKKLFKTHNVNVEAFYVQPAQYLSKHLEPESFDKILIDAPCSGEGLIDLEDKKTLGFWSTKKIKRLSKLQKSILAEAVKLLKPNGEIIYSTCTLAPEENEEVIHWGVQKLGLSIEKIELPESFDFSNVQIGLTSWSQKAFDENSKKCMRIKPNNYLEAFFVARLKKSPR